MASTTLTRTPSSAGNQKTWTLSAWVKNSYGGMFFCVDSYGASKSLQSEFYQGADYFAIAQYASGSGVWGLTTNRLFRDRNAWYHLVISVDTTQATSSDRVKIYVNGVQETSFSSETYPSLNYDTGVNSTLQHMIGNRPSSSTYFDGLMTHVNFIDGTAYDASTFGQTDATTGIWKPKGFSGSYGTNGFFLKFENSGSMGTDSSPNGNNFTVSGNLTQTVDTPSNVFCTMNPLDNYLQQATFTNGNTSIATATTPYCANTSTLGVSQGKWYFEFKDTGQGADKQHGVGMVGLQTTSASQGFPGLTANAFSYNLANGNSVVNNSQSSYGTASTLNDIYGMAVDLDNNKFWVSRNGTWINSGDPANGTNGITGITSATSTPLGAYFVAYGDQNDVSGGYSVSFNFGNGYFGTTPVSSATTDESGLGIFEYTVPSGYYALCTKNINEQEYD